MYNTITGANGMSLFMPILLPTSALVMRGCHQKSALCTSFPKALGQYFNIWILENIQVIREPVRECPTIRVTGHSLNKFTFCNVKPLSQNTWCSWKEIPVWKSPLRCGTQYVCICINLLLVLFIATPPSPLHTLIKHYDKQLNHWVHLKVTSCRSLLVEPPMGSMSKINK